MMYYWGASRICIIKGNKNHINAVLNLISLNTIVSEQTQDTAKLFKSLEG